jgi:hypothetical protein
MGKFILALLALGGAVAWALRPQPDTLAPAGETRGATVATLGPAIVAEATTDSATRPDAPPPYQPGSPAKPAPDPAKVAAAQRIDSQAAEKRAEAAKHAAWLDAAKKTRAYDKTVAALKAAEPNSSEQWALQTRLNNMLADI